MDRKIFKIGENFDLLYLVLLNLGPTTLGGWAPGAPNSNQSSMLNFVIGHCRTFHCLTT